MPDIVTVAPMVLISEDYVCCECGKQTSSHGIVKTLKEDRVVCPGDWIIKDKNGEYSLCNPDIFELTYEREVVE